ncbi:hypothetical protein PFICI_11921 [Pestalotiopsis fici W106-1]|uniref:Transcription factor domain-containing protein n=1 Tax=Pestalotiopsis fici (strain W106-1 / CGMCC3.15140) TaxID=1229662 RepID=W3WRS3_PESFW|nr:uncharacterized protein PFICI_11921 [Pestalotiopsis fici W106-1]ETS76534.1 hypothetical protein PFICI_11921 [Pestalotiopsis fici W106-1]
MPETGPKRAWRPLAPAPTASGGQSSEIAGPSRRSNLVKNACRNCQAKKTKLECVFDTRFEGMTKQQSAEFEIARLQAIITDLEEKLRVLRHGTYDEAQSMLALMRRDVQNHDNDHSGARVHDPLQEVVPSASCSELIQPGHRPSPEISDTDKEHDFPPLLFNRRDWTREPTTLNNDDNANSEHPAAQKKPPELLDHSVGNSHPNTENDLTPRHSNNFKNLPFSSAILANHHPPQIQQQQHANMFQSLWSILPLTTLPGPSSVKTSISSTLLQAQLLIKAGEPIDSVAGKSCNIAAIFNQEQYSHSRLLSKWAARLVFSIQRKKHTFAAFASMHLAWTLARWMIDPRLESFLAIPEWFRPTMAQLYMPHVELVDFLFWPLLRETITSHPDTLQRDWRWLEDMSRTVECDWFISVDLALDNDPLTGEVYLTESAKTCAEELDNWSVGSSAQRYIDATSIVKVRPNYE